ncbi:alpha/beta-hydrolase family protein [Rhizobium cauense]|uniref:alpha/beta hydrolase n=1 Tax=Rhizobium cauense TaxID=1166683 RepID=UPI001C6E343F|nr:alpha/beta-hydrolase family protein [Rhizobium cauense]MBW9115156.1 alpha/beta-hydrolase family protein [Rhizobium cauense]
MKRLMLRLFVSLSTPGLVLGFIFFAASLTPSLMPRSFFVQGALSGIAAAVGYFFGVAFVWLWKYLELPIPRDRRLPGNLIVSGLGIVLSVAVLWRAAGWQNSIRELWHMEPVDTAQPFSVALVAIVTFFIAVLIGRLFRLTCLYLSEWLSRFVPRRVSQVVGAALAIALFWSVVEGVLLRSALHVADASFRKVDALLEDDVPRPTDPAKTGSSASRVAWEGLGRQGRHFVDSGPTAAEIGDFWKTPAREPLRVYVGLNNGETIEERAKLALTEMKRQGAFERSVLVIIAPTGTGWVDPEAMDTLEYLHHGDVASVALQYSYLTSWLSLLVEPEYGSDSAKALFREVYGYWRTRPADRRPKLYLHGLSLGALNSQVSADIFDIVADPFQGALWSGPPFESKMWRNITEARDPQSPAWLPKFRDGSLIRFTNQTNQLDIPGAHWGPLRIVYLQYASDAVTFFDPYSFFREPAWMRRPRGPDVTPSLRWFPALTMLQLLVDMATATTSPMGYGHVYAPQHYIDGWIAVTEPQIDADKVQALKQLFEQRSQQAGGGD